MIGARATARLAEGGRPVRLRYIDYDFPHETFIDADGDRGGCRSCAHHVRADQARRSAPAARTPFTVVEATIPEMRTAMEQGRVTSRQLVQQYLTRIATYEDLLHAAITVNPEALKIADERDRDARRARFADRCTAFRSR